MRLAPGSRLVLYTDGVLDADPSKELTEGDLAVILSRLGESDAAATVAGIEREVVGSERRPRRHRRAGDPRRPNLKACFSRAKDQRAHPEDALPGRDTPILTPGDHFVLGTPMAPPFPDDTESIVFGLGCFWGAEQIFWQLPGVHTTAVGYGAGITPNPTYEEVCSGRTGHNEVVLVVFRPAEISLDEILRNFWEGHDPTQGMRQGNDVGTQYRSGIYMTGDAQREAPRPLATATPRRCSGRPRWRDHHRDRRRGPLLLRRGVPPAVPGEEPQRLLRPGWDGRLLPDGRTAVQA